MKLDVEFDKRESRSGGLMLISFDEFGNLQTWEEDKAFEDALATYYNDANMWDKISSAVPSKTIEAIKHHYEALCIDVEAIESGKVPMPDYPSNVSVRKGKKKSQQAQRGIPWTEEEHSQVSNHAQKHFKWLNSAKKGKKLSINDIRAVNPEKLLAFEKEMTSCMPGCCNETSTSAGFPEKAPTETGNHLLQHGRPKKARTDVSNQQLPPSPFVGTSDASPISGSGSSTPLFRVFDVSSPPFAVKPVQEASGLAPPGGLASLLEVPDHPPLESAPPASLYPYYKTWSSRLYEPSGLTSRLEITGHPTHTNKMARCYSTDAVMQGEPVQEAGGPTTPVEMPGHLAPPDDEMAGIYSTDAVMLM